jgi:hypothetical protein
MEPLVTPTGPHTIRTSAPNTCPDDSLIPHRRERAGTNLGSMTGASSPQLAELEAGWCLVAESGPGTTPTTSRTTVGGRAFAASRERRSLQVASHALTA